MLHTAGFDVVVQRHNGALTSKGVTTGAGSFSSKSKKTVALGPRSLVVTTLARHREHPFTNQPGWDLVVVDECLSVQSDSAMQAAEAWRSVVAARCGCLLLSATLFRSSYAKLFYMVRMLRSPLPRTPAYLPALLKEHVCCFVPAARRTWKLSFDKVAFPEKVRHAYKSRVDAFAANRKKNSSGTSRDLYVTLKKFLREHFEPVTLIDAFKERVATLRRRGRRVLVFANTQRELERLLETLPDAVTLADVRRQQGKDDEHFVDETLGRPLVVTVADASHGINLQDRADSVVCRPQPGDVLEQMKGRVDRPGQTRNALELVVLVAEATVEEAEAANIRLCGQFFRQYLDPLAKTFQERAVEAVLAAESSQASVAQAFARTLNVDADTTTTTSSSKLSPSSSSPRLLDVVEEEEDDDDDEEVEVAVVGGETTASTVAAAPPPKKTKKKRVSVDDSDDDSDVVMVTPSKKKKTASSGDGSSGSSSPPTAKKTKTPPTKKTKKERPPFTIFPSASPPPPRLTASSMQAAIAHLSRVDPKLAALAAQIGPPTSMLETIPAVTLAENAVPVSWRSLTKSVTYQQISVTAAKAILGRLVEVCGGEDAFSPETLLAVDPAKLLSKKSPGGYVGLSATKARYVTGIARLYADGTLSDQVFADLDDEAVIKTLRQCDGIGEWSAHMFAMFALGRPDILPVGDLAVQKAFKKLYATNQTQTGATHVNELPTRAEMERIAEPWRPYRTVGSFYMWHVVETSAANWV
mmetsp:Transcript_19002/g.58553  ORF Transcript_19002/g.58553 Transcript_19002/m.58553 type:complete len:754 (+) Transcript_19002:3-2264(+)